MSVGIEEHRVIIGSELSRFQRQEQRQGQRQQTRSADFGISGSPSASVAHRRWAPAVGDCQFSEFVRCFMIAGSETDTSVPILSLSNDCNSESFTRMSGSVHVAVCCLTIAATEF